MVRMAAASDFGDVQSQSAHPFSVGHVLEGTEDEPQVARDRCLQREQREGSFLGAGLHVGKLVMVANNLFGQGQIRLQQRLRRTVHRQTGETAHIAEHFSQRIELLMERRAHGITLEPRRPSAPSIGELVMNTIFRIIEGVALVGLGEPVLMRDDARSGVTMPLSGFLTRIVAFLRAGYPEGVPTNDYIPLLALLRRRLSDDEVVAVATELMSTGHPPVEGTDVRLAITKLTDEMPSPEDTERVERRLIAAGWPVTDPLGFSG